MAPSIKVEPFGALPDGREAKLWTLGDADGLQLTITNYGGAITSLWTPDREGSRADVVLGYDRLEGYLHGCSHFGATVGRCANRIAHGRFEIDGRPVSLPRNDGPNHLHGGPGGFGKRLWEGETVQGPEAAWLKLSRVSPDGEEGYPGNLHVEVTFTLAGPETLRLQYRAEGDRPTPINLTNHTYFNLAGHAAGPILGHELTLSASRFTPTDATLIPTGELRPVAGTALDFRQPHRIGERIDAADEPMRLAGGYDHNFVLEGAGGSLRRAALVEEPGSGRRLEVLTTEPGVQFYSGNFLDGTELGKGGAKYARRSGFCLETQHFPDAPNQPTFPSVILRPGAVFESTTLYRFTVRRR